MLPDVASASRGADQPVSDGSWVAFDDRAWGGDTEVLEFRREDCGPLIVPRAQASSQRSFSGCAAVVADADDVAGVGRELGPNGTSVDLARFKTFEAWVRSDAELEICLHTEGLYETTARCVTQPSEPNGDRVRWDMPSMDPSVFEAVSLVTFATRDGGDLHLEVSGLAFSMEEAGSRSADPHDAVRAASCGIGAPSDVGMFGLLLLMVGRKRASS